MAGLEEKDKQRALKKETEDARAKHLDLDDYAARASPESYDTMTLPGKGTKGGSFSNSSSASASAARPSIAPNARQASAMETMASNQREEDAALEELSDVLGALKEQSQVMNGQLTTQAKIIDGIESKVDNTSARLQKGTKTMAKIS